MDPSLQHGLGEKRLSRSGEACLFAEAPCKYLRSQMLNQREISCPLSWVSMALWRSGDSCFPPPGGPLSPPRPRAAAGLPRDLSLAWAVGRGTVPGCDWLFGWGHQAKWPMRRWRIEQGMGLFLTASLRLAAWEGSSGRCSQSGGGETGVEWFCAW